MGAFGMSDGCRVSRTIWMKKGAGTFLSEATRAHCAADGAGETSGPGTARSFSCGKACFAFAFPHEMSEQCTAHSTATQKAASDEEPRHATLPASPSSEFVFPFVLVFPPRDVRLKDARAARGECDVGATSGRQSEGAESSDDPRPLPRRPRHPPHDVRAKGAQEADVGYDGGAAGHAQSVASGHGAPHPRPFPYGSIAIGSSARAVELDLLQVRVITSM